MKANGNDERHRVELGRHIVADSKICGGQPTFKGTRIMVWIVLEQLEDGLSWDEVVAEWGGKVPKRGIAEAIAISDLVVKHEPFKGATHVIVGEPELRTLGPGVRESEPASDR